jgi:hypothetical protein|tara:strand:+ start:106 stop:627 length:522 start_codon:yes stop_codon:yes gene_type:complete
MDFSDQILGLLNWGRNSPKWWGIDFHLIPPEKRPEYLDLALQRFEDMYNDSPKHLWMSKGRVKFRLDKGRTMAKLKKLEGGDERGRIYAFVDINMSNDPERYGGLMKPASWKAPDKKKYIRAHLFAENPLRGAGWYGPDYMDGGARSEEEKDLRDNWFRTKNGIPFHREEALD